LYGFGYILPATFLPAQARQLIPDPALFGLAWPVLGIAAALSTIFASRLFAALPRRLLWSASQLVMAAGVLLPALWSSMASIIVAALCVGSTFMVITMLALQEAQTMGAANVRRLVAIMTASFAAGQLAGPLFFSFTDVFFGAGLGFTLYTATACLLVSCVLLLVKTPLPAR
jgi:MFS family permease